MNVIFYKINRAIHNFNNKYLNYKKIDFSIHFQILKRKFKFYVLQFSKSKPSYNIYKLI